MFKAIEGVFRNGKVELLEPSPGVEGSRVLVTFLQPPGKIDLASLGIDQQQAAELRTRLGAIAEDWDHPDMDVYDEL